MIQSIANNFGALILSQVQFLGGSAVLFWTSLIQSLRAPYYPRLIIEQIFHVGYRSLPLVLISALSTGMVMSLQFGMGLEKFGAKLYVPKIVSLSIAKELGPVFTSLMFAARVGAGIASEIGSMTVTQQIDAIRALGTSPIKRIVVPRVIACVISLPLLTVLADAVGTAGAALVGTYELGLDSGFFWQKVLTTVRFIDFTNGLAKTSFFALFIVITACYYGLSVREGTRGVGIATTKAVVASSILVVVSDFFLSKILWVLEKWIS
ncbi:MAG: ABC transporter permease [Bdellovibrionales bacterium]|nr:ABC transporter permease [Bdellovibrionales bacterium]